MSTHDFEKAIVYTFFGDESSVAAELLGAPRTNGLCKLMYKGTMFVRHVARVVPVNESAHKLLAEFKDVARDL